MPGTRCAVATCNNSLVLTKKNINTNHIVYHKFPNNIPSRKVWAFKCRRKNKFNPSTSHICSQHFNENAYKRDLQSELLGIFKKKKLKEDAIPTENLGLEESKHSKSTERKSRAQRREQRVIVNDLLKTSSTSAVDNLTSEVTNVEISVEIDNVIPKCENVVPKRENVVPKCENVVPKCENVVPKCENVVPKCENVVPKRENVVPKRENVVPKRKPCCKCDRLEKQNRTLLAEFSKLKMKEMKNVQKIKELTNEKAMNRVISSKEVKTLKKVRKDEKKKEEFKEKCTNILQDIFSPSQIKKLMGKKMIIWSADDLARAFTLRYRNKRAYLFLKNELRYPLPGLSTIRRYALIRN